MIVFKIGERVVGTTRSTQQDVIIRRLTTLAQRYVGQEVEAHYPEGWSLGLTALEDEEDWLPDVPIIEEQEGWTR